MDTASENGTAKCHSLPDLDCISDVGSFKTKLSHVIGFTKQIRSPNLLGAEIFGHEDRQLGPNTDKLSTSRAVGPPDAKIA